MLARPHRYLVCSILCWTLLQCNFPSEVPAQPADIPSSFRYAPVLNILTQADSLSFHSEFTKALQAYQVVDGMLPRHDRVSASDRSWLRLKMASMLIRDDRPEAAEALLDSIISKTPESIWASKARIEKGRRLQATGQYQAALSFYLKAHESDPKNTDGHLAFRVAYCYQQTKQLDKAMTWYKRAKTNLPVLTDYADYYTAECLMALNRSKEATDLLVTLKNTYPHSPFTPAIASDLYTSYLASNKNTAAIREIRQSLENVYWKDDQSDAALLVQKARAHEALGEPDSVIAIYRTILMNYRSTPSSMDIITPFREITTRRAIRISDEENLWIGLVHLNHRQYGDATTVFLDMVKRGSTPQVHPEVLYYLNRIRYLKKSYKTAEAGFKSIIQEYPDHPKAALASFHLARCIRARSGIMASLEAYLSFAATYPDDENAPDALLFVADQYFSRKKYGDAAAVYHKTAQKYPDYPDRNKAYWQEGYAYYRARNYEKAAEAYRALADYDSSSSYAPRGLYWAGKALQKHNKQDHARATFNRVIDLYPSSHYAYRALMYINPDQGKEDFWLTGWQRPDDFISSPPALNLMVLQKSMTSVSETKIEKQGYLHYTRAAALFQIGFRKEGEVELEWYSAMNHDNPQAQVDVVGLYYSHALYREGIRAASRLQSLLKEMKRDNQVPWQFIYPAPFWHTVQNLSVKLKLDPLFILAVMRQESRFDYDIQSWAGAYGLMQLMPTTAAALAKQQKISPYSTKRLLEPDINMTLGTHYLVELLRRFNGNPDLVLASYNGGPSRVSRWVRKRGIADIDEFIEEIGLEETRLFVNLVMNNYAEYVSYYSRRFKPTQ